MQVVIDIPEDFYYKAKRGFFELYDIREVRDAIANGIPLPKGHGRLVDAEEFEKKFKRSYNTALTVLRSVKTMIPTDKENTDASRD